MDNCPHCGSEEYYTKLHVSGDIVTYARFDREPANNVEIYDYLSHKLRSKYAFCADCNKRLFKIE